MTTIKLKRVYQPVTQEDGHRILVDRMWPRGLTREKAAVDCWLREVAPSAELRQWFGHEPERWPEFKKRYLRELSANHATTQKLMEEVSSHRHVTLLFGAHDEKRNQAVVLAQYLKRRLKP